MAIMKKRTFEREYVQVPNETAKAVEAKESENPISLQALGLIVNLWSYNVETWDLHKTELYNRFGKNARTSVSKAWDELVENNYIVEFKYRKGNKWDYVYYYNVLPYTAEEIEQLLAESVDELGVSSTVDFVHLKLCSTNCTVQNQHISNKKKTKEKLKKDNKKDIVNKENSIPMENIPFREQLLNIANEFYGEFASGRWSKKQWNTLVYKLIDDIIVRKVNARSYKKYIHGALTRIARHHDLNNGKVEFENEGGKVRLYNWLED